MNPAEDLSEDPDVSSTLAAGQRCLRRGLRLSVAAHRMDLPEHRAAAYERAQHEFEVAAWAAGELAREMHAVGFLDDARSLTTAERCCTRWAKQAHTARDQAAAEPIGVIPT